MRTRGRAISRSLLVLVVTLSATPGWAVKEWYDYYLEARDNRIPAKQYPEAIKSLEAAVRLRPASALNEQMYGLRFVDYLPYYWLGICYQRTGDFNSAVRMFNIEEKQGAVRKSEPLYRELRRLRGEAESARVQAENAERARVVREEVQRLLKEAGELHKARKFDEALSRLAQAQTAAEALDPQTQQSIIELRDKVRADERAVREAEERARRLEQALAEGTRLLEENNPTEAIVRFDQVLDLDPHNAGALAGKKDAEERILVSTTRASREAAFQEGKALFEAGRYEEAVRPLTDSSADPSNVQARELLEKTRKTIESLRQQKELRQKIDALLADGERLLGERKFPEAWVKLDAVRELDKTNVRALERLGLAERMMGEALLEKISPNQSPVLTFLEPREGATVTDGPTVAVVGVATDDRGIARIEFRVGGRVLAEIAPPSVLGSPESSRNVRFERELPLERGENEVSVTAVDSKGVAVTEPFRITQRERWYQSPAFLPSAAAAALGLVGLGFAGQRLRRARAIRRRFNPYIAGAPVMDEDMFFGREKLLARLLNVLHHNSLMITGERRIGKTTFLYHLKKVLEADEGTEYRFFPAITDLQGVPEESFFHAVMGDVVDELRLTPQTQATLRFQPDAAGYDGRDFSHDLQRVIDELKTRTPKRVRLALLIDEVDVLNEYSERINQRLRSIFMKTFSEHLVAIMSGVGIKRIWKSEGSPWYNFFDEIELSAFSREEAEALIREPVEGVFRFEPEAVEKILAGSELKPYVIQKFCINAVNRILEEGRTTITAADVEAVREAVHFDAGDSERRQGAYDRRAAV
jgi:tetratricopeptide (TPR) repeat protein